MSKYTPGPWTTDCVFDDDKLATDIVLDYLVPELGNPVVLGSAYADDHEPGIDQDQAIANARLMSAAPDLLEACKSALDVIRIAKRSIEFANPGVEDFLIAAINKAERSK